MSDEQTTDSDPIQNLIQDVVSGTVDAVRTGLQGAADIVREYGDDVAREEFRDRVRATMIAIVDNLNV